MSGGCRPSPPRPALREFPSFSLSLTHSPHTPTHHAVPLLDADSAPVRDLDVALHLGDAQKGRVVLIVDCTGAGTRRGSEVNAEAHKQRAASSRDRACHSGSAPLMGRLLQGATSVKGPYLQGGGGQREEGGDAVSQQARQHGTGLRPASGLPAELPPCQPPGAAAECRCRHRRHSRDASAGQLGGLGVAVHLAAARLELRGLGGHFVRGHELRAAHELHGLSILLPDLHD